MEHSCAEMKIPTNVKNLGSTQGSKSPSTLSLVPENVGLNSILRVLLIGTYDKCSPWRLLRGMKDLIKLIWNNVCDLWSQYIVTNGVFASIVSQVTFPEPKGININMMPFVIGASRSLPSEYHQYLPMIAKCPNYDEDEWGNIGYLTIQENLVKGGKSQRRAGLHTETPGVAFEEEGHGQWVTKHHRALHWGGGYCELDSATKGVYVGGICMASNVSNSCRVWNARIAEPGEVVGHLGDLEHLRSRLGSGFALEAGNLCWITDTTPHESLPLPDNTYRQYFRFVGSKVSLWYADHSTPNPLGIVPPSHVRIVKGNKFRGVFCKPDPTVFMYDSTTSAQTTRPKKKKRNLKSRYTSRSR